MPIMLPNAPEIMPIIIIHTPFELIPGFLYIILPIMYRISIYKKPVVHPVSHPFSVLFLPLSMPAVIMLIIVINMLIGETME